MVRVALGWLGCFPGQAGEVAPRTGGGCGAQFLRVRARGRLGARDACGSGLKVPVESGGGRSCGAGCSDTRRPGGLGGALRCRWAPTAGGAICSGSGRGWGRSARVGDCLDTW